MIYGLIRTMKRIQQDYLRSVVFGVEDSLVSTTGLMVGVAAGSQNGKVVLLAGLVAVAVEALSMGVGQYLSEKAVHEMDSSHKESLVKEALLMFFSYLGAGIVLLLPVILLPYPLSLWLLIIFALVGLFTLGYVKGRLLRIPAIRSGLQVFLLGGAAAILGLLVGLLVKI